MSDIQPKRTAVRRYLLNKLVPLYIAPSVVVAALAWLALLLAWAASISVSHSEPPAGTDLNSPEARWYQSLRQPGTGNGCCSLADCRPVTTREDGGQYSVFIDTASFRGGDDAWHTVPEEVIIRGKDNPEGVPVACWFGGRVRCFVPGSGA